MRKRAKDQVYTLPEDVLMGFNLEEIGRPDHQRPEDPQDSDGGDQGYPVDDQLTADQDRLQADGAGGNYAAQELKPSPELSQTGPTPYQQVGSPLASRKLSTIRKKLAELRRDLNGFKGSPEAFKQLQEAEENLQEATDALAGVIHFFSSVRTPQLSPDGKLGGRGYVRDIREMMGDLKEALSSASSALDTVSDERNNPSWEDVLAGEEEEFNKESVKDYENELEKEGHVSVGETLVFDFSHPDNRDEEATSQGGAFFKGSPALGGDPIVE